MTQILSVIFKHLLTHFIGDYVLISYLLKKIKSATLSFLCLFLSFDPLMANGSGDYLILDMLLKSCYEDTKSCNKALIKIHDYQKNAATSKKFSCQTRLLGLEAHLIMASNSNFKRKEAKSIIDSIKKYC